MEITQVDPSLVRISSIWSIYVGKYQVWYTIYNEDHGIDGVGDLASKSFYLDDEPKEMHLTRTHFFSFSPAPPCPAPDVITTWSVTRKGRIRKIKTSEVPQPR